MNLQDPNLEVGVLCHLDRAMILTEKKVNCWRYTKMEQYAKWVPTSKVGLMKNIE